MTGPKLSGVLIDLYAPVTPRPQAVTLDIDDTCDVAYDHQQLSLFNAYYDERCFLPIHVYDTATGRPVAIILRPGKAPSGEKLRAEDAFLKKAGVYGASARTPTC